MAKAVKLADIAKQLNTSTVTVSKALSGQKGMSDELRAQIKQLAYDMGYESLSAKKNKTENKSYNIGIIISERFLGQNESFYWLLYQELAKEAVFRGSFSLLEIVTKEDEKLASVPKLIKENKIDGLIVTGVMKDEYLNMIHEQVTIPVVFTDFYDRKHKGDYVVTDNFYGAYQITNYLLDMGHEDIAYVGTLQYTSSITDRYFGYMRALTERGIEVKKDHVIDDRYMETGDRDDKFEFKFPKEMPTAFVCNCDLTADVVVQELDKLGYKVPEDVSVVGFDNYVFNQSSSVEFTTYEVDIRYMAKSSIDIVLNKITRQPYRSGYNIIPGKVIIKDSVKRLS